MLISADSDLPVGIHRINAGLKVGSFYQRVPPHCHQTVRAVAVATKHVSLTADPGVCLRHRHEPGLTDCEACVLGRALHGRERREVKCSAACKLLLCASQLAPSPQKPGVRGSNKGVTVHPRSQWLKLLLIFNN